MNTTQNKFLVAAFLLCTSFTWAQIEVKGRVADVLTFLPLESASVYVQNTTIGTVTNTDGRFVLSIPRKHSQDTLVISSIGYKSFKTTVEEFDGSEDIYLEEDIASLDEVIIVSDPRPEDGNGVVQRAIERLERTAPSEEYLLKGFLRHRERNKSEYRWLIESALTVYDSAYGTSAKDYLKINVDETRKSYDLRDVDSLFAYSSYLRYQKGVPNLRGKNLRRDTIATPSLVNAIKWNDNRVNGLDNLFRGRLNLVRNSNKSQALFGKNLLKKHQFKIDTVLVDDGRKIYKIKIMKGEDYVGLNTKNIFNEGFEANGWLYIYYDNYAFKRIEYELVAASTAQKRRSKSLFDTLVNHKLVMAYREYNEKMYPSYIYYETPKLINAGDRSSDQNEKPLSEEDKGKQFYYTIQEILFTEVVQDSLQLENSRQKNWNEDFFSPRPYNKEFWKNYNVLLESEEEEKLINDLTQRAELFKQ